MQILSSISLIWKAIIFDKEEHILNMSIICPIVSHARVVLTRNNVMLSVQFDCNHQAVNYFRQLIPKTMSLVFN